MTPLQQHYKKLLSRLEQQRQLESHKPLVPPTPSIPYPIFTPLIQRYKELLSRLEQQRRSVAGGQDSMARARRLLRRAEAIKEEMTDSVEGIWMTFKVREGEPLCLVPQAVMEVLIAVNTMEADTLRLLPCFRLGPLSCSYLNPLPCPCLHPLPCPSGCDGGADCSQRHGGRHTAPAATGPAVQKVGPRRGGRNHYLHGLLIT